MKYRRTGSKRVILAKLDQGWRICSRRHVLFGRLCWSNLLYPMKIAGYGAVLVPRTDTLRELHRLGEIETCGSMNGGKFDGGVDRFFRRATAPGDAIAQRIIEAGVIDDPFALDEATVRHREALADMRHYKLTKKLGDFEASDEVLRNEGIEPSSLPVGVLGRVVSRGTGRRISTTTGT